VSIQQVIVLNAGRRGQKFFPRLKGFAERGINMIRPEMLVHGVMTFPLFNKHKLGWIDVTFEQFVGDAAGFCPGGVNETQKESFDFVFFPSDRLEMRDDMNRWHKNVFCKVTTVMVNGCIVNPVPFQNCSFSIEKL
jgi:hypothetical protein